MFIHHMCFGFLVGAFFAYYSPKVFNLTAILLVSTLPLILRRFPHLFKFSTGIFLGYFWISLMAFNFLVGALPESIWLKPIEVTLEVRDIRGDNPRIIEGRILEAKTATDLPVPMSVRLSCYGCESVSTGVWKTVVKLKPIHGFANPGGRSFESAALVSGLKANGSIVHPHTLVVIDKDNPSWVSSVRMRLRNDILDKEPGLAPLLMALVIGDKSALTKQDWLVLRNTGTTHLLAISGLHLSIVAACLYALCLLAMRVVVMINPRWPAKTAAWVLTCLLSTPYVLLTGGQLSAWRAYIMIWCLLFVFLGRRSQLYFKDLALVAVGVLLISPFAVGAVGLWLSVGAVCLLIVLGTQYAGLGAFKKSLWMQWRLSVALGIVVCAIMGNIAWISPVANVVAIPWVSFIVVPLCFIYTLISWFSDPLASWVLGWAAMSIKALWWFLQAVSGVGEAITFSVSSYWAWGCALAAVLLLLMPATLALRAISAVFVVGMLLPRADRPLPGDAWIDVVDVGQGLGIVVRTAAHTMVYDTGARFNEYVVAEETLLPFMAHEHIHTIDMLMVSHQDTDHSGGLFAVMAAYPVQEILVGDSLLPQDKPCIKGQNWVWDGVQFTVLSPADNRYQKNNRSCVLKVSTGSGSILLTGDIEAPIERLLMVESDALRADVLVVPHHGSKTSSTEAFIDAVKPRHAIISAGFLNRYHHPHPLIMQRYRDRDIKTWNTAQEGQLRVTLSYKRGVEIVPYLEQNKRWWQQRESHT